MTTRTPPAERLVDRPSVLEAERADVLRDLERYFDVLASESATPIAQDVAAVLAFDRLDHLHELDTAQAR
jgi:hypothetical protein